jgi:uncharacterized integral membrane protein
MRFIILLLLLGIGIVFFLQNQQLVTLVFFGNVATVTLPIAVWVLSFIGVGILTSFCWQILSSLGRLSTPQRYSARQSRPYSSPPPPPPRISETPSDSRPPQDFARPGASTRPANVNPKDYEEEWDDWEVEQTKREPVREFVREFPRERIEIEPKDEPIDNSERFSPEDNVDSERIPEDNANSFEVQQQPKTSTRTGSVYSYVYREPKDRQDREAPVEDKKPDIKEDKSDRVYDADYRVIRPPYQPPPEQPRRDIEDDDDWI